MLEPFGNKRAGCHAFTRQPRGKVLGGNVRLDYFVLDKPRDTLAHGRQRTSPDAVAHVQGESFPCDGVAIGEL